MSLLTPTANTTALKSTYISAATTDASFAIVDVVVVVVAAAVATILLRSNIVI